MPFGHRRSPVSEPTTRMTTEFAQQAGLDVTPRLTLGSRSARLAAPTLLGNLKPGRQGEMSPSRSRNPETKQFSVECLLLALSGHPARTDECPLLGVKLT